MLFWLLVATVYVMEVLAQSGGGRDCGGGTKSKIRATHINVPYCLSPFSPVAAKCPVYIQKASANTSSRSDTMLLIMSD